MFEITTLSSILKVVILTSILFVWVIRYKNIIEEFNHYKYPAWLRDFVGIMKISSAILIQSSDPNIVKIGCISLALLMSAAFLTHIKIKNKFEKMLPSISLLAISLILFLKS